VNPVVILAGAAGLWYLLQGQGAGQAAAAPDKPLPIPPGSRRANAIETPILEQAAKPKVPKDADVWIVPKGEWAKLSPPGEPFVRKWGTGNVWIVQEDYVAGIIQGALEGVGTVATTIWNWF
jgi:hypothetical protein